MKVSLASADIPFRAYLNVFDCLKSERIGRGKYVSLLEERFSQFIGARHCIAVGNGTLADIIMLATLKELYPGKTEVILPALTFIAHANSVLWAGLKPVFVDVMPDFQIDWTKALEKVNDKTLCIFPAHLLGKNAWADGFNDVHVPIIEDCCEAMGGVDIRSGKRFGTLGLAGSFSMYPSHTITTGEGGLIVTNDDEFARIARSIHNHGKKSADFDFEFIGINAKMTNLQAAIGCELVKSIDTVNALRRRNVGLYNKHFVGTFYAEAPHCFPVVLRSEVDRDACLKDLEKEGIEARKLMGNIPAAKPFAPFVEGIERRHSELQSVYPEAARAANRGLFVPIHQRLKESEIFEICDILLDYGWYA